MILFMTYTVAIHVPLELLIARECISMHVFGTHIKVNSMLIIIYYF